MLEKQVTIEDIEEAINKVYIMEDTGIVRMILANVIGNIINIKNAPIWTIILAPSSGGKTAMMDMLSLCKKYIVNIDTLTANTFASGQRRDEETSLLHKANKKVFLFEDFTVVMSMNEDSKREIMGQLRRIYDGEFKKETGNNVTVDWKGKVGFLAGGTTPVQRLMRDFSKDGERFLYYSMKMADYALIAKRSIHNQKNIAQEKEEIAKLVERFVHQKITDYTEQTTKITETLIDDIVDVAVFCTRARSPVQMNRKNPRVVDYVGDIEVPGRMATMMANYAHTLMYICEEKELGARNASLIYQIGLDSIPVDRRVVLQILAKYTSSSTKNLAIKLNLTTETVGSWLSQVNALCMVDRRKEGQNDVWTLKEEYKDTLCKYLDIKKVNCELEVTELEELKSAYADDSASTIDEVPDIDDEKIRMMLDKEF